MPNLISVSTSELIVSANYRRVYAALCTVRALVRLRLPAAVAAGQLPDSSSISARLAAAKGYLQPLLDVLSAEELLIIKLRYFDCKSWTSIAFAAKYSDRQAQRIRARAVWRLADYQDRLDRADRDRRHRARRDANIIDGFGDDDDDDDGEGGGASPVTADLMPLPSLS